MRLLCWADLHAGSVAPQPVCAGARAGTFRPQDLPRNCVLCQMKCRMQNAPPDVHTRKYACVYSQAHAQLH